MTQKKRAIWLAFFVSFFFAEREGFEPPVPLPVQRFSKPSHSTTLASLLIIFRSYRPQK